MPSSTRVGAVTDLTNRIRDYLFRDGRGPGDRVETEEELAETFSVSRYQIRRVLNTMVQHGLLTKTQRRGTFIRHFDPSIVATNLRSSFQVANSGLKEYLEARVVIERAVLPLSVKRITDEQIAAMEECIERMLELEDEPEKADEADRDFHVILLSSCGNEILASFTTIISMLFHDTAYRSRYWNRETIERLAREHRRILDAIKARDIERALALHENHLHYRERLDLETPPAPRPRRSRR